MEGDQPQPQNADLGMIDMAKVEQMFEQKIKDNLRVFAQDLGNQAQQQQANAQAAEQQRQAQAAAQQDAFGNVIAPYIAPVQQRLQFQTENAVDYSRFYTDHPEAVKRREEIERVFQQTATSGTARPREDVWNWMAGRDALAKEREEAAKAALQASTIKEGASTREPQENVDPYTMTQEERREWLGRTSF